MSNLSILKPAFWINKGGVICTDMGIKPSKAVTGCSIYLTKLTEATTTADKVHICAGLTCSADRLSLQLRVRDAEMLTPASGDYKGAPHIGA